MPEDLLADQKSSLGRGVAVVGHPLRPDPVRGSVQLEHSSEFGHVGSVELVLLADEVVELPLRGFVQWDETRYQVWDLADLDAVKV